MILSYKGIGCPNNGAQFDKWRLQGCSGENRQSPTSSFIDTKNLNGLVKVYVYMPGKSAEYSDHINLVSITSSFTCLLH